MRVTKNKLKSEYGALSGDIKASNVGTPKKTATPKSKTATPKSVAGTPSSKTVTPGSVTPTPKRGRPGGKKSRAEMEEADGVEGVESSGGSEIEVQTPSAKKGKKTNGVKAEPDGDELGFGDEEDMFQ